MLKIARAMLTAVNRPTKPVAAGSSVSTGKAPVPATNSAQNTTAITRLTAGPANATQSSWRGTSGMRSNRATPPIGSSVISRVWMP